MNYFLNFNNNFFFFNIFLNIKIIIITLSTLIIKIIGKEIEITNLISLSSNETRVEYIIYIK